ncbi:MAG: RnfABCDGE type electron transport complex subunit B [Candidatus Omnitrophica bacterium]|nr:RnfABCDGE type electron transport complex subunit B [Candidatus Omnitrophota bacterium]MDD5356035.1 RnfABCDGE type electron transport complex subunit B [Candidatus Omnitrophota bacterium]
MEILLAVITLGGLGLLFGLGLALASKKFYVKNDPRLEKIIINLPGANCGACGMAGCMGFAEGLISGKCTIDKCPVTEPEKKTEIANFLGHKLSETVKTVAVLHCGGGNKVKDRFKYEGIKDCNAANLLHGGQKACIYGCLGFGSCVKVCPFGAIKMNEETGLPEVDEEKCTACGKCVETCPKKLFSLVPADKKYYTKCSSLDFGKAVLDVCPVGCIGCRKCEKSCPQQAIKVINNLAVFDYKKCRNTGECFKVCPRKCIIKKG